MFDIHKKYNPYLSKLFSNKVILDLILNGHSKYIDQITIDSGIINHIKENYLIKDIFQIVYEYLQSTYRNEYVYKNIIVNKLLLGKHTLDSSFMLSELRVGNCKADIVILNGTSNVYEIKSDLDNLERLSDQIASYEMMFDMVHVIAAPHLIEKIRTNVGDNIGLMTLDNNDIKTIRDAQSDINKVFPEIIFDSLRKSEYTEIIKKIIGEIPQVPNSKLYKTCKEIFCQLEPNIAHNYMVEVLKKRGNTRSLRTFLEEVPDQFRAYALSSGLNKKEMLRFQEILNSRYSNSLIHK